MKYFYVNNKKYILNNKTNFSIIDFCESIGETIPHFCYHKQLSIAGNCRMCLVELKNSPKPLISCAMFVVNKMEIYTNSPLVKKARENVLEFLLLNHPLDCPVCDQGGECDLQDQSFNLGVIKKRFYSFKRSVHNKNFGILIKTLMTRCIHCTRCVRFSQEVSGTSELGVFGRGLNSEIGTYKLSNYNSELSANVIDICPVGALTSKPYSFVSRSWELKTIKCINFSDSFSQNLLISIKNNTIYKILPTFDSDSSLNLNYSWITDKTRFSFNGMFSPERVSNTFLMFESTISKKSWKFLFKEFALNLFFQDQLIKHKYVPWKITLIVNETLSLDLIFILLLINKQYSFFNLKKLNLFNVKNDLEKSFFFNSNFSNSKLCWLIDINPRYEGPLLNILIRKLYLSGNFNIFYLGSLLNLTYPVNYLGSNFKIIKEIVEGNHPFCQKLISSFSTQVIVGSSTLLGGSFYTSFYNILNYFNRLPISFTTNFLNPTIEISNLNYLKFFKNVTFSDFFNSNLLFFLDTNFKNSFFKKIIELKILKYKTDTFFFKTPIIIQSSFFNKNSSLNLHQALDSNLIFNFPNKNFFEESGVFLNNLGILKRKIKIISNTKSTTKSNWYLLKTVFNSFSKVTFSSINSKNNYKYLVYRSNNFLLNLSYLNINFLPTNFYSKISLEQNTFNTFNTKVNKKKKKTIFYFSKNYLWYKDFFIGNLDLFSKFSTIMIKCSKNIRKINNNFLI